MDETLAEVMAAVERAQTETLRLKQAVDGYEERLAAALRRIDNLEATHRRIRDAVAR